MFFKNYYSRFVLLLLLLLTSAISSFGQEDEMRSEFSAENGAIPPAFGAEGTVLVCILRERKSYDKYLKKGTEGNYKGDYIFLTRADFEDEKYNDVNKYRFVFDYEDGTIKEYSSAKRFYVEDRVEG